MKQIEIPDNFESDEQYMACMALTLGQFLGVMSNIRAEATKSKTTTLKAEHMADLLRLEDQAMKIYAATRRPKP
jgi:hypothetical protein